MLYYFAITPTQGLLWLAHKSASPSQPYPAPGTGAGKALILGQESEYMKTSWYREV